MHRSTSLVGPTARWQKHLPPFTQGHLLPAPVTQSLSIASLDQLWILTTCCQPGRSLHGYQKKALPQPQACVIRHQLQCPAQPGAHCPKNIVLELPDSGVDLGPFSWSWSLRVSMDGRALSCRGQQDSRRTQLAAFTLGKSGQSASLGAKMGPAQGTQLYSVPKKAHPGLCPNL